MIKTNQKEILLSKGFLLCLGILIFNDFWLKQDYPSWITGKLSDFSGLFIFPLFWTVFFPNRKLSIFIATACLFIFWKSPYSQFLINSWNSLNLGKIHRVVDFTDLIALTVLPLAYLYSKKIQAFFSLRYLAHLVAIFSLFAFMATSCPRKPNTYQDLSSPDTSYEFSSPIEKVTSTIQKDFRHILRAEFFDKVPSWANVKLSGFSCYELVTYGFILDELKDGTRLTVIHSESEPCGSPDPERVQQHLAKKLFEEKFVKRLRNLLESSK